MVTLNESEVVGEKANVNKLCNVFLCHNRHDQFQVKQIAEGLELEFGIPHFLDDYAIPVGEEFLPWIQKAMKDSQGCVIFLGRNGWGPTHLLEAEKALLRYQADDSFRLIPIVLEEVYEKDIRRLGNGTVFRDINWLQFKGDNPSSEAMEKLRAAITDEPVSLDRGPAKLTPYLLRREALRWKKSGIDDLLLTGKALEEARVVRASYPDLTSSITIIEYLDTATTRATSKFRRLLTVAIIASFIFATLAAVAFYQRTISHSRELAAQSISTAQLDDALLLAVSAREVWPTVESRSSIIKLLTDNRYVNYILHGHQEGIRAVNMSASGKEIAAGGINAILSIWNLNQPSNPPRTFNPPTTDGIGQNQIHDLKWIDGTKEIAIAYERGGLKILSVDTEHIRSIEGWPPATAGTAQMNTNYYGVDPEPIETRGERAVTKIALQPNSTRIAAIDSSGRIFLTDKDRVRLDWIRFSNIIGAESVHWTPNGKFILVGDERGKLDAFSIDGTPIPINGFRNPLGRIILLEGKTGNQNGFFTIDRTGLLSQWRVSVDSIDLLDEITLPITPLAASISPDGKDILLTTREGIIRRFDLASREEYNDQALFGHRLTALSVSCNSKTKLCASAGIEGKVIVWNLARQHPLLTRIIKYDSLITGFWRILGGELGVLLQQDDQLIWQSLVTAARITFSTKLIPATFSPRNFSNEIAIAKTNEEITVLSDFKDKSSGIAYKFKKKNDNQLYKLAISRTGEWLISVDRKPKVTVWWRSQPEKPVFSFEPKNLVSSITISQDEKSFVIGTFSGEVIRLMLNPLDQKPISRKVANGPIFAMSLSASMKNLYVGSGAADRNIRILKYPSLQPKNQLPEVHRGSLSKILNSSEADLLASSSQDGVIELWNQKSLRRLGSLPHKLDTLIQDLQLDLDGETLFATSNDKVFEWQISDKALIIAACKLVNLSTENGVKKASKSILRGLNRCNVLKGT